MKNLFTRLLFLGGLLVYLFLLGFSSGAPTGRTGAPGETTCGVSSCHNNTPNSGSATIKLTFGDSADAYVPGETQKLTIAIEDAQNAAKNGFEIVALDELDANVGEWILSGGDKKAVSDNGRDYVTHSADGNAQSAWDIEWKAPAEDVGKVTFYLAVNDANNAGGQSGDNIYTTALEVNGEITSAVKDIAGLQEITAFPNPFSTQLNLKLNPEKDMKLSGTLVNFMGQRVATLFQKEFFSGEKNESLAIPNNLSTGLYFLELKNEDGGTKSIPIIKQ